MPPNCPHFVTGRDVLDFFRSNRQDVPIDALRSLRNQLFLKADEASVSVQDGRLTLVKEWLELSPGAEDVFTALEKRPQPSTEAVCLSLLASLLTITSQHHIYQPLGYPIVQTLLVPHWLRRLSSHLSGGNFDLCLSALKLLNSVSTFAAGREQKTLLDSFAWDVKVLQKLLRMRRKDRTTTTGRGAFVQPDIRTLCLHFILSFLHSSSHVKTMFLEQHRDIFLAMFKGIDADSSSMVRYILQILWNQLWQDNKVRKTLKVALFGERTIQQLLKLYDRSPQEDSDPENIPANVVHHFLLAICTHKGVGVCFADSGWYPRQENVPEGPESEKGDRIHNKILANVLRMLKVSDDARQQELALKILGTCPELVAGYLQSLTPALEPRLSSKWLASMAFFGAVLSLPIPMDSFYLPCTAPSSSKTQSAYRPVPPPLSTIVNSIAPSTILKAHLTKALQSSHPLLQHSAGLLLVQCLRKYEAVQEAFRTVTLALQEDEMEGQWARRLHDVDREMRRRIPEIHVVIAFASAPKAMPDIKSSTLSEVAQRLLWMYHRCVPLLVAEARYDLAKSLRTILDVADNSTAISEIRRLHRLQQLHILRTLTESDQFIWYAKPAPSGPSNLYILLGLFLKAKHISIRQAVLTLLTQALRDSLLFQHDPDELHIWLNALPTGIRSDDAEAPDGARLADERQCVMQFLEACMQRCAKTPHRYLEELDSFIGSGDATCRSTSVSPILITLLEQIRVKMQGKALDPSDALALMTFTRRVIIGLLGKQPEVGHLHAIAAELKTIMTNDGVFIEFPNITMALRKECNIVEFCLEWCTLTPQSADATMVDATPSEIVNGFVSQVEKIQNMERESSMVQAYKLVDWLRLLDHPLSPSVVSRIAAVVKQLCAPALSSFCLHLEPATGFLWSLPEEDIANSVPIDWLLLCWNQASLSWCTFISILRSALRKNHQTLHQYKRFVGLVFHRLCDRDISHSVVCALDSLIVLMESAKGELHYGELSALKHFVLSERQHLRRLACLPNLPVTVVSALDRLLGFVLDPTLEPDRLLVSPICDHWVSTLVDSLENESWQNLPGSLIWIKFISPGGLRRIVEQLFRSLHACQDSCNSTSNTALVQVADAVFVALGSTEGSNGAWTWLSERLVSFLSLRKLFPTSASLDKIIFRCIGAGSLFGHRGMLPTVEECPLHEAIGIVESYWAFRLLPFPRGASVLSLLDNTDWSLDQSRAIASLIYRSPTDRRSFWAWLVSGSLDERPTINRLAPAIHAVLDSCTDDQLPVGTEKPFMVELFRTFSKAFFERTADERDLALYSSCLVQMMARLRSCKNELLQVLLEGTASLSPDTPHLESLLLTHRMIGVCTESMQVVDAIVSRELRWAVKHLSENKTQDLNETSLVVLTDAVRLSRNVAAYYAESVLAVAIRHHICHPCSMHLAAALLVKIMLKPTSINRLLQSILQHSDFSKIISSDPTWEGREAITRVLFALFLAHPKDTFQPPHIQPVVQLYSGSLSAADCRIFAIFHLFEEKKQISVASIITQWSQVKTPGRGTALDAILSLDPARLFRTCLSFPDRRAILVLDEENGESRSEDALIYNPIFILLLFAQASAEWPAMSALHWVSLYRTNVASLVLRCLSSAHLSVRRIAVLQLDALYRKMQGVDMQEKSHVIYLLDVCRDLLKNPSDQSKEVSRLPSYTTLFLAHALRFIFYPASFMYPPTARFLLQRPQVDSQDVPLLYNMLYSSDDNWRRERGWLVRFLADGLQSGDDWRLLKRRHTWDLLASLFQESYNNTALRYSILEVLANLTCHPRAATFLVLRSSVVHWMEIQLHTMKRDESIAWTKIIENIVVAANLERIEEATKSGVQNSLLRCLTILASTADVALLRLVSRTLVRLDSNRLSGTAVNDALDSSLSSLREFERLSRVLLSMAVLWHANDDSRHTPPHRSIGLHLPLFENNLESWGKTVENLWSVSMKRGESGSVWGELTSRLLLWRALVGDRNSPLGEWAGRQSMSCNYWITAQTRNGSGNPCELPA